MGDYKESVVLHHVDYTQVDSLASYLKSHHYWINLTIPGKPTLNDSKKIKDLEAFLASDKVKDKLKLVQGQYLEMARSASSPMDQSWKGCSPRVELASRGALLPKGLPLHISFEFAPCGDSHFRGLILQTMDHDMDDDTMPLVQLEIRNGKLMIRWSEAKGSGRLTRVHPIAPIHSWAGDEWFKVDLFLILAHKGGRCRAYLNNHFVWELVNKETASDLRKGVQLSYGCYGLPGTYLVTHVKRVHWALIDKLPQKESLE